MAEAVGGVGEEGLEFLVFRRQGDFAEVECCFQTVLFRHRERVPEGRDVAFARVAAQVHAHDAAVAVFER